MTNQTEARPFLSEHTLIGAVSTPGLDTLDVTIIPLPVSQATPLGAAFAAIDPWASYPYPADALARYLAQGDVANPILAVQAGARTVGVLGLKLNWLRGPYIQFLGFLPGQQNLGLGKLALDWVERETRSAGQRNIFVAASDFNAGALRFYERFGFARVGPLKGLVNSDRDEILLHKKL